MSTDDMPVRKKNSTILNIESETLTESGSMMPLMGQQFVLAVALTASVSTAAAPTKPNIVLTLTDDLGWNTAWNNDDIISPTLDALASQGLKLSSFYVYRYCSPTRAAFLTGRSPYKLLNIRENLIPTTIPQSTDPRFTMLPKRLAEAGYKSYLVGKWHQGFAKKEWTPTGRGFDESWGFLSGGESHFTQKNEKCTYPGGVKLGVTDYWRDNGTTAGPISTCDVPAADRVSCVLYDVVSKNSSAAVAMAQCAAGNYAHCAADASDNKTPCFMCKTKRYTGYDFSTAAVGFIEKHAAANAVARQGGDDAIAQSPFFLYLALHNTHGPIEAPAEYVAMYNYSLPKRNTFDAMVSVVDSTVANVTEALKKAGMWSNTLFIWTTDNGSPCQVAGSNDPLRGNKGSDWEGGARVPAFISGGMLPPTMAGRTLDGIVAIWDLFATACGLAGIDPTEPNPASPTPVDSFDSASRSRPLSLCTCVVWPASTHEHSETHTEPHSLTHTLNTFFP